MIDAGTPIGSGLRVRRMIGVQRSYSCTHCGADARSWSRLSRCPRCGDSLSVAVIRRAAFTRAAG